MFNEFTDPVVNHLVTNVLNAVDGSSLLLFLEHNGFIGDGIDSTVLLMIPFDAPMTEQFKPRDEGAFIKLPRGIATMLQYFILWTSELRNESTMTQDDWLALTAMDFRKFRLESQEKFDIAIAAMRNGIAPGTTSPGTVTQSPLSPFSPSTPRSTMSSSTTKSSNARSPAEEFRRGIKRDKLDYPLFTDERYWDKFRRQLISTARAHGVSRVLDSNFKPVTTEDTELFHEQQVFMYSVFDRCLLTEQGKHIVQEHLDDSDAQEVYRKVYEHYTSSTTASYSKKEILKYLVTAKYDSAWAGSSTSFILHWRSQLKMLHDITPVKEHLPDHLCMLLLSIAIDAVAEFRSIMTAANLDYVQHGQALTFEKYCSLLSTASIQYDKQNNLQSRKPRRGMRASMHDFESHYEAAEPDYEYAGSEGGDQHDAEQYYLHALERAKDPNGDRRPHIPQEIWNTLPDVVKDALRWRPGNAPNRGATPQRDPTRGSNGGKPMGRSGQRPINGLRGRRNVSFGDVTHHDDGYGTGTEEFVDCQTEDDTALNDTDLLEALGGKNGRSLSHGDIRRVMSHSHSQSTDRDTSATASTSHADSPPDPGDHNLYSVHKLDNGRTYMRINEQRIQYRFQAPTEYLESTETPVDIEQNQMKTRSQTRRSKRQKDRRDFIEGHRTPRGPGRGSLIDSGANGGMLGADATIIATTGRFADVTGIQNYKANDLEIVSGASLTHDIDDNPVIVIFHSYAKGNQADSIHSSGQMGAYGHNVDEKSRAAGGRQTIITRCGRVLPLHIRHGLAHLDMVPATDAMMSDPTIPHVILTEDTEWDPTTLDNEYDDPDIWSDARYQHLENDPEDSPYIEPRFDDTGNYMHRYAAYLEVPVNGVLSEVLGQPTTSPLNLASAALEDPHEYPYWYDPTDPDPLVTTPTHSNYTFDVNAGYTFNLKDIKPSKVDFAAYQPMFGWAPIETIKRTWAATTRLGQTTLHWPMRKHYKARNPALNIPRRNEAVATDTIYSDTPAINGGQKYAQLFVGRRSLVTDVYPLKSLKEFVNTVEDEIRKRGAMTKLISDSAAVEISKKVKDLLRTYGIDDWQSEPHHQHQNPAERRIGTILNATNNIMNHSGAPAKLWLLALMYTAFLYNHFAHESLGWRTPLEIYHGSTPDITAITKHHFHEKVYYALDDTAFPSGTTEAAGWFVGFSPNVGDALTFKVLTCDTLEVISRSTIRSAEDPRHVNRRLRPHDGESPSPPTTFVHSRFQRPGESYVRTHAPTFDPSDLLGRTFLKPRTSDGQQLRARVTKHILDPDLPDNAPTFLVQTEGTEHEEIVTYNQLLDAIESDLQREHADEVTTGIHWKYQTILGHEGPLQPTSPNYKGSTYNVLVHHSTGERIYEPLDVMAAADPMSIAIYAREHGMLETPGWERFNKVLRRKKKFTRMLKHSMLKAFRTGRRFKFGYEVPNNHADVLRLDAEAGNTKWQDSENLEVSQLMDYTVFEDKGKAIRRGKTVANLPEGYQLIRVRCVYDVKHDGRHKSRIVAGGHLTPTPVESVYSGVVSIRSIRLVTFLAELNGLQLFGADIGNAYLEADTKERVAIVAGPEFGDLEGHLLIIRKALYGLRTSGKRWAETFAKTLESLGFMRSKADPDVWMRKNAKLQVWEYIATYVDDLLIACEDAAAIVKTLREEFKYKIKGDGPLDYHLGITYTRDADGTLYYHAEKYIARMMDMYKKYYGELPAGVTSPLEKGDHPELDESELLNDEGIRQYQSLTGGLQWLITLGRFDVATSVMTMSRFRAAPRVGHLHRLKRIFGYVHKFRHAAIRIRTELPDYSDLPDEEYDWTYTVYGKVREQLPDDLPEPLGKKVQLTTYKDANLYHDMVTGRAVTGIIHLLNGTPVEWYSKRQATVETATYGSEFVAARTAVDQIIDIKDCLRYLGVPIVERAVMFGDNQSVVTSSTLPHSALNKRHNALSYHRVREAIAAGIVSFFHIDGKSNPADIVSKHWGHADVWKHLLKPMLFWRGDTADCITKGKKDQATDTA